MGALTSGDCLAPPLQDQSGNEGRQCVRPGPAQVITAMDDALVAGLFTRGDAGLVMLVDARTVRTGKPSFRLSLNSEVTT